MKQQKLVGTWKLKNFEIINLTANKLFFPYGEDPVGILVFSADGYMSVSIMSANRSPFLVESLKESSTDEKTKAIETYMSYAGTWKLECDTIFVKVITSLLPNWKNKEHHRTFQLSQETLTFQTPKFKQGDFEVRMDLTWERA